MAASSFGPSQSRVSTENLYLNHPTLTTMGPGQKLVWELPPAVGADLSSKGTAALGQGPLSGVSPGDIATFWAVVAPWFSAPRPGKARSLPYSLGSD